MNSIKMRRNNKILLGLLAMLLVMSTGYALFSKEITIGGNVTAKGSFNMTLSCAKGINSTIISAMATAQGMTVSELNEELKSHGYTTDNCTVSGSSVTTTTGLNYPGATRYYTIEVKNTGDIPAKWSHVDGFEGTYNVCGGSNASVCDTLKNGDSNFTYDYLSSTFFGYAPSIRHLAKKSSSGTYTILSDKDIGDIADSEGYIYLEAGESLFFVASNTWYSHFDTNEYNNAYGNYQTYIFNYNFNFEQATE